MSGIYGSLPYAETADLVAGQGSYNMIHVVLNHLDSVVGSKALVRDLVDWRQRIDAMRHECEVIDQEMIPALKVIRALDKYSDGDTGQATFLEALREYKEGLTP